MYHLIAAIETENSFTYVTLLNFPVRVKLLFFNVSVPYSILVYSVYRHREHSQSSQKSNLVKKNSQIREFWKPIIN